MRAPFEPSEARETDRKGQPEGRGQRRTNVGTSRGFRVHNAHVHRFIVNDACIGAPSHAAEPLKRVPMRCSSIPGSTLRAIHPYARAFEPAVEAAQEALKVRLTSLITWRQSVRLAAFLRESSASGGAQVLSTSPCSR